MPSIQASSARLALRLAVCISLLGLPSCPPPRTGGTQTPPHPPLLTARFNSPQGGILMGFIYPTATDDLYQVDSALRTRAGTRYFAFTLNLQTEPARNIELVWRKEGGPESTIAQLPYSCEEAATKLRMLAAAAAANRNGPAAWSDPAEQALEQGTPVAAQTCLFDPLQRPTPSLSPDNTAQQHELTVLLPAAVLGTGGTLEMIAVNALDRVRSQPTAIRIVPSPVYAAAVGDSVIWGQGLNEGDKVYSRMAAELRRRFGDVVLLVKAHSGATLFSGSAARIGDAYSTCARGLDPRNGSGIDNGEVSERPPAIQCQIIDLSELVCSAQLPDGVTRRTPRFFCPGAPAPTPGTPLHAHTFDQGPRFDVVLMDGCINDIGAGDMVRGQRGYSEARTLSQATARFCDYRHSLPDLSNWLPRATVLVTGYHRILATPAFDFGCLFPPPLPLPGVPTPPDPCVSLPGLVGAACDLMTVPSRWVTAAQRTDQFFDQARSLQRESVQALAQQWKGSGRPVFIELASIYPQAAGAFGRESRVWEWTCSPELSEPGDLLFRARDPVRDARMRDCNRVYGDSRPKSPSHLACDRASLFHPDAEGARLTYDRLEEQLPTVRPD